LVGIPEGNILLGISSRRGKNNIKMYLGDTEWQGVGWIHMIQNRNHCGLS
jgi:hypothetical protein